MSVRTVFFVSDQTGITAETVGQSLLTQFDGLTFHGVTVPFVNSCEKAEECVRRINVIAEAQGAQPIVFATLVQDDLRETISSSQALVLDLFEAFISPLEQALGVRSSHAAGKAHGVTDQRMYKRRIDAMNYALEHDDGASTRAYTKADIILIGVSRSGKTPTCLYMALRYGVLAGNYPLTEEDLMRSGLPPALQRHRERLFGLTIAPCRLEEIRRERRPKSKYASARQISFEVEAAEALFARYAIKYVDTTLASIEEIAGSVLDRTGVLNRLRRDF